MYAVCSALSYRVNKMNAQNFMKYIRRLPEQEFAAFAIKDAMSRFPDLKKADGFREWVLQGGAELIL